MEEFEMAMRLYGELTKTKGSVDHETEDITSNYLAARAQNTWVTGIAHQSGGDELYESYEVYFNLAYELTALEKLTEAEDMLNRSQSIIYDSTGSDN